MRCSYHSTRVQHKISIKFETFLTGRESELYLILNQTFHTAVEDQKNYFTLVIYRPSNNEKKYVLQLKKTNFL